jgi:hypothetical protein
MQGLNEILAPLLMISFEGTGGIGMPRNFRYIASSSSSSTSTSTSTLSLSL